MGANRKNDMEISKLKRNNHMIWLSVIFLCGIGLIMVYSSSSYECASSAKYNFDSTYFVKKQAQMMAVGFLLAFVAQYLNYKLLEYLAEIIYLVGIVLIVLLKTSLGVTVNGATRWLRIGIQFQVAEVVKICVIIALAFLVVKCDREAIGKKAWKVSLLILAAGGIQAFLLLKLSNDLSSAVIVLGITFIISFVCTKAVKLHIGLFVAGVGGVIAYCYRIYCNMPDPAMIESVPFRTRRIAAWIDPERYADSAGYQILQSLYAIGRGGFTGKGLGQSIQKLGAIPEAQNDMIFSIICEELGVIGAGMILLLFFYLVNEIFRVSLECEDPFGRIIAMGVALHIGLQVVVNVAVNLNVMPNTGIALPFISYGGTAVALQLAEIGLVLSVERREFARKYREAYGTKKRRKQKMSGKRRNKSKTRR